MAVFIDLCPCLITTKLSYAQLFKWVHSKEFVLILNVLGRQKLAIFDISAHVAPKQMVSVTYSRCWHYGQNFNIFSKNYSTFFFLKLAKITDKRTDVWSQDFMIWKINFGLWAVVWAGQWEKRVWTDYEQLLRTVFSLFQGQKNILNFF